ncbi:MAG: hypothetical protein ABI415_10745 [Flavitalea sp.]
MRKFFQYSLVFIVSVVIMVSCRKGSVQLPTNGNGGGDEIDPPVVEVPQIPETDPAVLTAQKHKISENILGYYSALPAHYSESDHKYPLMIFFHGGGQYGNGDSDLVKVLAAGVPKLLNNKTFPPMFNVDGENFSFIVMAPQLKRFIQSDEVDQLLKYSVANYRVDTSRIYLVGFSLGAQQLCNYAGDYPGTIAALTAMAGVPYIDDSLEAKCQRMVNTNLPIWHFHNLDDQAWPYTESVKWNDVLNSYNPSIPPRFTTFQVGEGKSNHDCWTRTMDPNYKESDSVNIYEWMLAYKR